MKKLLVPSPDNREACLKQLWDKLYLEDGVGDRILDHYRWIERYVSERSVAKVSVSAGFLCSFLFGRACIDRRRGNHPAADASLRQGFSYVYLARELHEIARMAPDWCSDCDDLLIHMVTWQAMSAACGSKWFALWLAPHLHNEFGHPDPDHSLIHCYVDKPATRFMEVLQQSLVTGIWPTQFELLALSGYGPLLQSCGQPEQWSSTLVEYCDWRIANSYGYPYMGAPKRRRKHTGNSSVLEVGSIEQVFPLELLTLKFAYEQATGKALSLDAPHPMLQGPLMTLPFPPLEPMHEDEWTLKLEALRAETGADRRGPREPITARYL